jgi:hypothetical protein
MACRMGILAEPRSTNAFVLRSTAGRSFFVFPAMDGSAQIQNFRNSYFSDISRRYAAIFAFSPAPTPVIAKLRRSKRLPYPYQGISLPLRVF